MTRQQRRFEQRNGGHRTVGFTPVPRRRIRGRIGSAPQRFMLLPNGGYCTLHATKGWRTVSPKRLRFFPGFAP
jgi:hypothetical protein